MFHRWTVRALKKYLRLVIRIRAGLSTFRSLSWPLCNDQLASTYHIILTIISLHYIFTIISLHYIFQSYPWIISSAFIFLLTIISWHYRNLIFVIIYRDTKIQLIFLLASIFENHRSGRLVVAQISQLAGWRVYSQTYRITFFVRPRRVIFVRQRFICPCIAIIRNLKCAVLQAGLKLKRILLYCTPNGYSYCNPSFNSIDPNLNRIFFESNTRLNQSK
jgi:hypothetical protein